MSHAIGQAFQKVKRVNFVPDELKDEAHLDVALPIGFGQTISQPFTVRLMLEWLEPRAGDKLLDVGSGSGWTTGLLAYLVGPKGMVYAVEKIPELKEFGEQNCRRLDIKNAKFFKAGNELGLPQYAPFDRILVSATAEELPSEILDQLKVGGKMVIPVRNDILEISKFGKKNYETITHSGFIFVPLVT